MSLLALCGFSLLPPTVRKHAHKVDRPLYCSRCVCVCTMLKEHLSTPLAQSFQSRETHDVTGIWSILHHCVVEPGIWPSVNNAKYWLLQLLNEGCCTVRFTGYLPTWVRPTLTESAGQKNRAAWISPTSDFVTCGKSTTPLSHHIFWKAHSGFGSQLTDHNMSRSEPIHQMIWLTGFLSLPLLHGLTTSLMCYFTAD